MASWLAAHCTVAWPRRSLYLEFYRLKKDQTTGNFVIDQTKQPDELDVFFFATANKAPETVCCALTLQTHPFRVHTEFSFLFC